MNNKFFEGMLDTFSPQELADWYSLASLLGSFIPPLPERTITFATDELGLELLTAYNAAPSSVEQRILDYVGALAFIWELSIAAQDTKNPILDVADLQQGYMYLRTKNLGAFDIETIFLLLKKYWKYGHLLPSQSPWGL